MTPPPLVAAIDTGVMQAVDQVHDRAQPAECRQTRPKFRTISTGFWRRWVPPPKITTTGLEFRRFPGMGPNAFALPNGHDCGDRRSGKRRVSTDAMAGVIGHEIGHVAEQHGLTQIYRSLGTFVLIGMMAGDTGPVLEQVLLEGNLILSLSYSRQHELAADRFGVDLARPGPGSTPTACRISSTLLEQEFGDQKTWTGSAPIPVSTTVRKT